MVAGSRYHICSEKCGMYFLNWGGHVFSGSRIKHIQINHEGH